MEEKVENKPRAGEFPFLASKNAIEIFEAVNFGNAIKRSPGICVLTTQIECLSKL